MKNKRRGIKMKKITNVSLGAVHTHTHTHTTNLIKKNKN